jgi:hypothetical protein
MAISGILRLTYTFVALVDNKLYSPTKKLKKSMHIQRKIRIIWFLNMVNKIVNTESWDVNLKLVPGY